MASDLVCFKTVMVFAFLLVIKFFISDFVCCVPLSLNATYICNILFVLPLSCPYYLNEQYLFYMEHKTDL